MLPFSSPRALYHGLLVADKWVDETKRMPASSKPKKCLSICGRLPGEIFETSLSHFRQQPGGMNQIGRLVSFATQWIGRKIRAVGLDQNPVVRNRRGHGSQIVRLFERDHAGKADIQPQF